MRPRAEPPHRPRTPSSSSRRRACGAPGRPSGPPAHTKSWSARMLTRSTEAPGSSKPALMWILRGLVRLLLVLPIWWAAGALWLDGPASRPLAGALALAVALGGALSLLLLPFGRAVLV